MYALDNLGKDICTRENGELVQISLRIERNSVRYDNLAQSTLVDAVVSLA